MWTIWHLSHSTEPDNTKVASALVSMTQIFSGLTFFKIHFWHQVLFCDVFVMFFEVPHQSVPKDPTDGLSMGGFCADSCRQNIADVYGDDSEASHGVIQCNSEAKTQDEQR